MVHITYFVHGTTTDNEQGLATGWLPGELSEKGRTQAEELGQQIARRHFDVVIASDLQRAIDTARTAFKGHEVTTDFRLREANYGDNNGKPTKLFKAHMEDFIDTPFPNGESYRDVEVRLRSLCDDLRQKYDNKRVALVAHQGPQLALDVIITGKSWPQAIAEDWRNTHAYQDGWDYTLA
jgi:broad specificity phosphatase PhoE